MGELILMLCYCPVPPKCGLFSLDVFAHKGIIPKDS